MKRPLLKRSKKQRTPQELGFASNLPPPPKDPLPTAYAQPTAPAADPAPAPAADPASVAPADPAAAAPADPAVAAPGDSAVAAPADPAPVAPAKPAPAAPPEPSPDLSGPADEKPRRIRPALEGMRGRASAPLQKVAGLTGRTRLVVWGVLVVIVVVVLLSLSGGRDDERLVREALASFEQASARKDYQTLCDDLLASSYVRQTASSGLPCEVALRTGLEDVKNPTLEVLSVEVNGDRAAARVRGTAAGQRPGEDVYTLVREDDTWRILPPRPQSTAP